MHTNEAAVNKGCGVSPKEEDVFEQTNWKLYGFAFWIDFHPNQIYHLNLTVPYGAGIMDSGMLSLVTGCMPPTR